MIFTKKHYSFDSNNPIRKYGSFTTHGLHSVEQVPHPLVIFLDDTWDTKGIHVPVCFPLLGAGSGGEKSFIRICFRQRLIQENIAVIFQGTGRSIADFDK